MEQQNFYLLLNLSIDPPEEDPKIIEKAIKKKQAEWSRHRNHPTKGIQAKYFIDLIPEIRKVMLDPELRVKHAEEAQVQLDKEDEKKFLQIDRHLYIYLNKGSLTNKEVYKLVQLHGLEVEDILKRAIKIESKLKTKPERSPFVYAGQTAASMEERISDIEKYLGVRMYKGYLTDKEIEKFSKLYSVEKEEIKKQIEYPIRETPHKEPFETKTIDKSIEKSIDDNLKIIGKASLYEFLELPISSDIDTLQKNAGEKRRAMLATTQKNAVVTASGELAGHCITIFKTQESRITYDVTRAITQLKPIDSDIEVAQIDGVIRLEYFEAIIDNAAKLGIEHEVVNDYIEEYCKRKNWKAKSKQKRKRLILVSAAIISLVLAIVIGTIAIVQIQKSQRLEEDYLKVSEKVTAKKILEEKREILLNYIGSHDQNKYVDDARVKIKQIENNIKKRNALDERDYQIAIKDSATLYDKKNYEAVNDNYGKYISAHPKGVHADELSQKVSEIPDLIDKRDFGKLKNIPRKDYNGRITAYDSYLNTYPQGKYKEKVLQLIAGMSEEYYRFIKKEIAVYEKRKQWDKCIQLCNNYLKYYKDSKNALDLKGERLFYQKQLENMKILKNLIRKAQKAGKNHKKAIKIYQDYLKQNPKSPIRYEVKKKINTLKKEYAESY